MYCKKCGCRINGNESRCTECGTEISRVEYCGGFWGLVGVDNKKVEIPVIENVKRTPVEYKTKVSKKQKSSVATILVVLVMALALALAGTGMFLYKTMENYKLLQVQYEELLEEYEQFDELYESISDEIEN